MSLKYKKNNKNTCFRVFLFLDDLYDVLVVHDVREADALGGVLGAGAPDEGVLEGLREGAVDGVADVLDGDTSSQDEAVVEVGWLAGLLCVHPDQGQAVPQYLQEVVQVQLHVAATKRLSFI